MIAISLLLFAGLGCNFSAGLNSGGQNANTETKPSDTKPATANKPAKLDSYSIKGIKFAYYKIPPDLKESDLIETAQKIHEAEPDTQLILVDDDSELAAYIKYAKAISGLGELEDPMPMKWADKHIIANVQKYTSGKFVLCEGYGSKEIADLK